MARGTIAHDAEDDGHVDGRVGVVVVVDKGDKRPSETKGQTKRTCGIARGEGEQEHRSRGRGRGRVLPVSVATNAAIATNSTSGGAGVGMGRWGRMRTSAVEPWPNPTKASQMASRLSEPRTVCQHTQLSPSPPHFGLGCLL